ncbi:MAG: GYF domain-containing protein [Candidatus Paceibacterota bacterium]|jgi:hypothetical protein
MTSQVKQTVMLMGKAGILAATNATEACGPVEKMLEMYFEDNKDRTPQQAMEDVAAMQRIRPLKGLLDSCKEFKALIPQVQELIKTIMALCPTTKKADGTYGALCEGGILKCLMSLMCPGLCPTTAGASPCPCFDTCCPTAKGAGACDCFETCCPTSSTEIVGWYTMDAAGVATGPFTLEQMKAKIADKTVTATTTVGSLGKWVKAQEDATLKSLFA